MEEEGEWTTYISRRNWKKKKTRELEKLVTVFVDNMPEDTQAK